MKIIALTRIRNEEAIIQDTLDHVENFAHGIYVYDDASNDDTLRIVKGHKSVLGVIENKSWSPNRAMAETENRRNLLNLARSSSPDADWFVYLDADERIEFDWEILNHLPQRIAGIRMKLFDFYITPDDVDQPYYKRQFIGPEYRNILMAFRNSPKLLYDHLDQRSPRIEGHVIVSGFVRHYGKAISVQQWEDTCDYYSKYFPKYSQKWKDRKGKAIHTMSDFGRPLITWEEKEVKGIKLY